MTETAVHEPRKLESYLAMAVEQTGSRVRCSADRNPANGPHEIREFGPALSEALKDVLVDAGIRGLRMELNCTLPIANFSRAQGQVDLVVFGNIRPALVAELKCWDIGHQLFDLAKVCCLLSTGVPAGYLVCVARRTRDFDHLPGGELFPPDRETTRVIEFRHLLVEHRDEWRKHVGSSGPEPTVIPTTVATTTIASGVSLDAYPGHEVRAVRVTTKDPTPIQLSAGQPVE